MDRNQYSLLDALPPLLSDAAGAEPKAVITAGSADAGNDDRVLPEDARDALGTEISPAPVAPWAPAADAPATFGEALTRIEAQGSLLPAKLRRSKSDIACAAKLMGRAPETLPTRAEDLVRLLKGVTTDRRMRGRLGEKRWSNIRSTLVAVGILCGAHAPRHVLRAPLRADWAEQVALAPDVPQRSTLAGAARYAQSIGVGPAEFQERHLQEYGRWRAVSTYTMELVSTIKGIRSLWNRCRVRSPAWRGPHLVAVNSRPLQRKIARLEDCHPELRAEFERYLRDLAAPTDPLGNNGRPLAEATVELHRARLLAAIAIRARQVGGLIKIRALADIADPSVMKGILLDMHRDAGGKWTPTAVLVASILVRLAKSLLPPDDARLREMRALRSKVVVPKEGRLPRKVRERLAQFDDDRLLGDLLYLPRKLCDRADSMMGSRPIQAAHLHRRGCALQILITAAVRRRNLQELHRFDDLIRDRRGKAINLRIEGTKTKTRNGIAIEGDFDPWFVRALHRYETIHRPRLPNADSPWLFPSPKLAGPMTAEGLANTLSRTIRRELGVKFNLHLVRHIVASVLFRENANNGLVVQRVLTHNDIKTTERMYGDLGTRPAQAQWAGAVERAVRRARRGFRAKPNRRRASKFGKGG